MSHAQLSPAESSLPLRRGDAFELMCACAHSRPDPQQVARIGDFNCLEVDWQQFLRLAGHHGVVALAAQNLIRHAPSLPPDVAPILRSAYEENLRRSLWFGTELARILQHFGQVGLAAIPYKGPVLAQFAYGDLGLRSFSDLDLLVSPSDFARAKTALADISYRPSQEISPAVERLWLKTGYERSFDSSAGRNLVELQWALLPYFYAIDSVPAGFQIDDLRARAGSLRLGMDESATLVPCLSPEDSLLLLCLHAAKHLWTRLIWVADVAESLQARAIDFPLLMERAKTLGILRILAVSCWLAENLLGTPLPPAVRQLLLDDRRAPLLGQEYAARLAQSATYDFASADYFRQIFQLRERSGDRWRYLWRLVWTPGPGDVSVIKLPEFLFPLYRVIRIGRLPLKLF